MRYPNPFFKERFIQSGQEVRSFGSVLRPRQWIVARSLCYFKIFDLQAIEHKERKNALNVKIMQWSPFQETGRYVLQHHHFALVWIWDAAEVQSAMYAQDVATAHVAPETLVVEPSKEDGFRLVECLEGYEGQYWKDGMITASRWWPELPDARQLDIFFLGNDLDAEPETSAQPAVYLSRPWPRRFNVAEMLDVKREGFWVRLAAAAAVLLFSYFGLQYEYVARKAAQYEALLEQAEAEAAPIKAAQNRMRSLYDKYMGLYEIVRKPSQLQLLYDVHNALPEFSKFEEWQFSESTLRFVAPTSGLKPMEIVSKLQTNKLFENISVDKFNKDMYAVTLKVAP